MILMAPHNATSSQQVWQLLEQDYKLRLSLVASEWATEYLRAWNAVLAEGRKRNNAGYFGPALVNMAIADVEKRAEWSYRTCCEIWEIQGRVKSKSFFRVVFDAYLQPMFSMREGCFIREFEMRQKRTGASDPQNLSAIVGHMKREMSHVRARWNTILEIATRDVENAERLKREQEASGHPAAPADARPFVGIFGSSFNWKELEMRFREIQTKTTPQQNIHATFIRTEWDAGPVDEQWIVSGNLALQKEIEHLGSLAARKLRVMPCDNPHEDWLERVRVWMQQTGLDKDRRYSWPSFGSVHENERIGKTESMSLENLAELSALYCMHLMANGTPESLDMSRRSVVRKAQMSKKQLRRVAVIFGAIQSGLKGHKYCSELDARKVWPSEQWKEEGCPDTYVLAYRDLQWRKRIQNEKCRYRKRFEKTPPQERETIIQGGNGTRPTRGTRR